MIHVAPRHVSPRKQRSLVVISPPRYTLVGLVLIALATSARAGDWPQILGPDRNGSARDEKINVNWPSDGPPVVWEHRVGSGFAGPVVQGSVLIVYHRVGSEEVAEGLDAKTGQVFWEKRFPTDYRPLITPDDGPRAVPLIEDERVFLYGATGDLRCVELRTGKLLWERQTQQDYGLRRTRRGEPPRGYFGIGSSPIVVGDNLVVNVGGSEKQAGIVAFNKLTGKTVWKATDERASYSSPVLAEVSGTEHLLFATRLSILSIDPASGQVRFQFPFGRQGPTVTAANPVVLKGHALVTASYGIGAALVNLANEPPDVVWRDPDLLASQYTTCVEVDGSLIGIDGRQDGPDADLKCFDPLTRAVHWTKPSFGYATLLKTERAVLVLKTDGTLVAIAPSKTEYRELNRAEIFSSTTRALPALSRGKLYARDERTLKCVDLSDGT
jgi:outer membrane protein assembly factor BamB